MGLPIVHIEIAGTNGPELESFYRAMFDWKIDHQGEGDLQYGFIQEIADGDVGGGIRHEPEGPNEIVFYVEVENLENAVAQAVDLGASVRINPIDTGKITFALITDPQGNPVGLIQKP